MVKKEEVVWALLRLFIGFIFLWGFLDKLFGLGFSTAKDKAWLLGASPTAGFLKSTSGIFSNIFQSMAGSVLVDWLFMLGLLLIGVCLIFGIALRTTGYAGALFMLILWLALIPLEHNPILDEHIINFLVLIGISIVRPMKFSLAKNWYNYSFVKKYSILR